MKPIAIAFSDEFRRHDTGPGHPERPERLDAVRAALEWSGLLSGALPVRPTPLDRKSLERVHPPAYIDRVRDQCAAGSAVVDEPDCSICPASYDVALLAAGAVVEATRHVAAGEAQHAFCAVRPPGHHAERDRAMGFCLFANVALAVQAARHEFGLQRIAVVDWDVHHGNGTQHIFEADPDVLFVSLHGHPATLYPGTGYEHEIGVGAGEGFTLNIPMHPGSRDADYREAFERSVLPRLAAFEPQLLFVSAGFDAHADDPLGNQRLSDDAFAWMTQQLLAVADRHASGRLISVLEGGYNLGVLRRCVGEHVRLLAGA